MAKKSDAVRTVKSVIIKPNGWKYGEDQLKGAEEEWLRMTDPAQFLNNSPTGLDKRPNLPTDIPQSGNNTFKQKSKASQLKRHEFSTSVKEIIRLVSEGEPVEGIDLIEKMQDSSFQFKTTIDPTLGERLSDAFTAIAEANRAKAGKKGSVKSREIRNDAANSYAARMYNVIEEMKKQSDVLTVRATVDLLNKNSVETPNGGKWRINTLQSLEKRWRELGLAAEKPKPK